MDASSLAGCVWDVVLLELCCVWQLWCVMQRVPVDTLDQGGGWERGCENARGGAAHWCRGQQFILCACQLGNSHKLQSNPELWLSQQ